MCAVATMELILATAVKTLIRNVLASAPATILIQTNDALVRTKILAVSAKQAKTPVIEQYFGGPQRFQPLSKLPRDLRLNS